MWETDSYMTHVLGISPERIAHDLHPDFETTRYAENITGVEKVAVQHHHAHVVACMAEHQLAGPVIGLALDGNGHGLDGAVWAGEVLVAEKADFQRVAHLGYVPMPGGDAAIREPWRMAVGYLHQAFGNRFQDLDLPLLGGIDAEALHVTTRMIKGQFNSPPTSSAGRLFDGVSALIGLRRRISFEGQAAMALEAAAGAEDLRKDERYPYDIPPASGPERQVDLSPIIQAVVSDVIAGMPARDISRRFHGAVIAMFSDLCSAVGKDTGIRTVVLSGGVFQNALVLSGITRDLTARGFHVYAHSRVPANDGGLSLGQALVAAHKQ
jgi:hydrogenase maturation protein HypF